MFIACFHCALFLYPHAWKNLGKLKKKNSLDFNECSFKHSCWDINVNVRQMRGASECVNSGVSSAVGGCDILLEGCHFLWCLFANMHSSVACSGLNAALLMEGQAPPPSAKCVYFEKTLDFFPPSSQPWFHIIAAEVPMEIFFFFFLLPWQWKHWITIILCTHD